MKIILREDVPKLGKAGEVVKVKDGYARNYLIPKGLAVKASENNVRQLEHERKIIFLRQEKAKRDALKLAEELKNLSITIPRQVGEEDRIFGSVSNRDIAEALRKEGYKINRKQITFDEHVRTIGVYTCQVKLHPEVVVPLKVWVVAE